MRRVVRRVDWDIGSRIAVEMVSSGSECREDRRRTIFFLPLLLIFYFTSSVIPGQEMDFSSCFRMSDFGHLRLKPGSAVVDLFSELYCWCSWWAHIMIMR